MKNKSKSKILDMRGTVARWRYPGGPVAELW
jgi:hypothetical protein